MGNRLFCSEKFLENLFVLTVNDLMRTYQKKTVNNLQRSAIIVMIVTSKQCIFYRVTSGEGNKFGTWLRTLILFKLFFCDNPQRNYQRHFDLVRIFLLELHNQTHSMNSCALCLERLYTRTPLNQISLAIFSENLQKVMHQSRSKSCIRTYNVVVYLLVCCEMM